MNKYYRRYSNGILGSMRSADRYYNCVYILTAGLAVVGIMRDICD